jgi:hypothetical protein
MEAPMSLTVPQLKRTLRQLKRLEITFRVAQASAPNHPPLVWEVFFSTREHDSKPVKYPFSRLIALNHEEFKAVIDEYFQRLYSLSAQSQDVTRADVYDAALLAQLDLPPHAGMTEIIQRFRTLAKQYHPDHGGEAARFIELVTTYERLRNEPP